MGLIWKTSQREWQNLKKYEALTHYSPRHIILWVCDTDIRVILHFCYWYLKFPLIFTVLRVIYVHTNPCFMASIFQPTDPLWERGLLAWTRPLRKWPSPTTCWEVMWLCSYNSKEAVITVASFTLIKSKYCNSSNSWISFLLSYRFSSSEFDGIDATEENAGMKGPGENG